MSKKEIVKLLRKHLLGTQTVTSQAYEIDKVASEILDLLKQSPGFAILHEVQRELTLCWLDLATPGTSNENRILKVRHRLPELSNQIHDAMLVIKHGPERAKAVGIELPEEEAAPETVNPYVCPCCGGDYITGHSVEAGEGRADQEMTCETCGAWWHDIYVLDRQEIFEEGKP